MNTPVRSLPVSDNYHTQHAPFGAFASFTIGLHDAPGGFGQSLAGPARQNVYAGFRTADGDAPWRLLPFFTPPQSGESAFTGEIETKIAAGVPRALGPDEFTRNLGWASDTWRSAGGKFGFSLLTPFSKVPDPQQISETEGRRLLAPLVTGWIEYDNRRGSAPVELMFGLGVPDRPLRPLHDIRNSPLAGFAAGGEYGYATTPSPQVALRQAFNVFAPTFRDYRGLHAISGETALVFTVPARRRARFPLVLGFFVAGETTSGLRAAYSYTRFFENLEDVLTHGLAQHAAYAATSARRDRELARSKLSDDQRFLLAQATHSYQGSTQLLSRAGRDLWVVNEGEYRMMNTFDLTVDHLFFELAWHPWAVRNALEQFARRYAYVDRIRVGATTLPGGISFTHDMGVMNYFTPRGRSSYECDNLRGCFSHMTMEQLLNWVLCAVSYAEKTGDWDWLQQEHYTLIACAESLRRRDHPDPRRRNGILKHDSDRCGPDGAEITTYDSLDVSLGQARNNLYLAVKTLGAWVLLEPAFTRLNLPAEAAAARATADLLAASIGRKFENDTGFFPAVFEADNRSRILPAIEGLVYPLYLGYKDATRRDGRFAALHAQLRRHLTQALQPGVCLDAVTGAWKISSTSTNTWFSKIALAQYVARKLYPEALSPAARRADRIHADWQRAPGCGRDAMCDQIRSDSGLACGSRYYPRGVTACLWLLE